MPFSFFNENFQEGAMISLFLLLTALSTWIPLTINTIGKEVRCIGDVEILHGLVHDTS